MTRPRKTHNQQREIKRVRWQRVGVSCIRFKIEEAPLEYFAG